MNKANCFNQKTKTELFVRNIPSDASRKDLTSLFRQYGKVASIKLKKIKRKVDKNTAMLVLISPSAKNVKWGNLKLEINGKPIMVERKLSKAELLAQAEDTGKRMVYVANIPKNMPEDRLFELFERAIGGVESVKINKYLRKMDGVSPRSFFGFVRFKHISCVQKALEIGSILIRGFNSSNHLTVTKFKRVLLKKKSEQFEEESREDQKQKTSKMDLLSDLSLFKPQDINQNQRAPNSERMVSKTHTNFSQRRHKSFPDNYKNSVNPIEFPRQPQLRRLAEPHSPNGPTRQQVRPSLDFEVESSSERLKCITRLSGRLDHNWLNLRFNLSSRHKSIF